MFLELSNEIDKQISDVFSQDVIDSILPENIDFFGINLKIKTADISLKTYYLHDYSLSLYNDKEDDPLIKFLKNKRMLSFFSVLKDSACPNKEIYEIKIRARSNANMLELFSCMDENISFFGKYKEEIIKLSTMKNFVFSGSDYGAFYFFSVVKDNSNVETLKCYWDNNYKIETDDYFFNFLQESGVNKLIELIPMAKTLIKNCGGHLALEGINYNKDYSEKHKIYITDQNEDLYAGLIKTFPDNFALHKSLLAIASWQKIHKEFYCAGFSIGTDEKGDYIINFYYKFVEEDC